MSELYSDALNVYSDIKIYFDSLNERFNILSQSIEKETNFNYRDIVELAKAKKEIEDLRREIPVIGFLLGQITDITKQFFREHHQNSTDKTAESSFIEFLNSSTYKTVMGGFSLDLKHA